MAQVVGLKWLSMSLASMRLCIQNCSTARKEEREGGRGREERGRGDGRDGGEGREGRKREGKKERRKKKREREGGRKEGRNRVEKAEIKVSLP
jgi:hypothetical protein